jgi:DNA (cytosine-5)-methyltransferase 1
MDRNNNAGMVRYSGYPGRWFRLLTIREAFLLMGYNVGEYEKIKKLGLSYRRMNKLIGNSIVVNVLAAVFKEIFKEETK